MRGRSSFITALLLIVSVWSAAGMTDPQSPQQRTDTLREHGLDPLSSLESRVRETPAAILKMFADAGMGNPTAHTLTDVERRKLTAAFAALPPLHRRVLGERLRTVSFLDGMPNTALTSMVDPKAPYRLFDITIRAGVLNENVSEFLTQKERTCFDTSGSSRNVSIDAGTMDALVYVLIHEATHVVDNSLLITPSAGTSVSPLTAGIWKDRTTIAPQYDDALLNRLKFRAGGEALSIDRAEAVYAALRRTPFLSLYGSSNWHDDVAETVTWYHLTERLKQPFRIVISDAGKEVSAYEPAKADIVRTRFTQMDRFYDKGPQA